MRSQLLHQALNCTLVELKFGTDSLCHLGVGSKLYLSGIEIGMGYEPIRLVSSPNCTLVELKFSKLVNCDRIFYLQIVP